MERLWNRNYIKVMIANFMLYFAFYVLTPLLPIYLNEYFAASKDTIGMVLSGYTVAALIIRPFSGYLVDSFDRKHILLIFFSLFAACFIGYFWAGTLLSSPSSAPCTVRRLVQSLSPIPRVPSTYCLRQDAMRV